MIVIHYFPIYWGWETEAPDRSFVTRSTLDEILPPFRKSVWAFRIRVSRRHWLHVGWFEYDTIDSHWGTAIPPEVISTWRGPHVGPEEETSNGDSRTDEVRSLE